MHPFEQEMREGTLILAMLTIDRQTLFMETFISTMVIISTNICTKAIQCFGVARRRTQEGRAGYPESRARRGVDRQSRQRLPDKWNLFQKHLSGNATNQEL
jgi:hypothetical protein